MHRAERPLGRRHRQTQPVQKRVKDNRTCSFEPGFTHRARVVINEKRQDLHKNNSNKGFMVINNDGSSTSSLF